MTQCAQRLGEHTEVVNRDLDRINRKARTQT